MYSACICGVFLNVFSMFLYNISTFSPQDVYSFRMRLLQIDFKSLAVWCCSNACGVVEVAPQARPKATTRDRGWLRCYSIPHGISFPFIVHCLMSSHIYHEYPS